MAGLRRSAVTMQRLAARPPHARARAGLVALGALCAVAMTVPAAGAGVGPGGARLAVACADQTDTFGAGLKPLTVRFLLHGNVTCREAHRTMRAYARAVAAGRCPTRICAQVRFAGGWQCAARSAAESRRDGVLGGCSRLRASFDFYKARA
jgi:hypothetical protein